MPQDDFFELPPELLERLHLVPELPLNYLKRTSELDALKKLVLAGKDSSVVIAGKSQPVTSRIGLHGMGGIGKSVLAAAVVRERDVLEHFTDGIFWLTIGQTPQIKLLQSELAFALSGNQFTFETEQQGKMRLGELLRAKRCLLVLDDVWESRFAMFFNELGAQCRMLVTTRNAEITKSLGAKLWSIDLLDNDLALKLLAKWAGAELPLPPDATAIAKKCENLPLALSLAGALVGDGMRWSSVLEALEKAKLEILDQEQGSVQVALKASLDHLAEDERAAYLKLAVFPSDVPIPEPTLYTLWKQTANLESDEVERLIGRFKNRALLRTFGASPTRLIKLHDLQHLYLKNQCGNLNQLHAELIQAYWNICPGDWYTGPNDGYFFERLPYHLKQAGLNDELRGLLFDFCWMEAKLGYLGVPAVMADYRNSADPDVELVYQTLQLSSHILNKDKKQLRSQLWGRLVGFASTDIQKLLNQAKETSQETWLRPIAICLMPPDGPLLFTLEGHTGIVNTVAVFPDGKQLVSGSDDGTVRVWDLEIKAELTTFIGHTSWVTAVAVFPDGTQIASAAYDGSLKVWDVGSRRELATLNEKTEDIRSIAVLPGGKRIVSASGDKTIKIWDVEREQILSIFTGHTDCVTAVAVCLDGKRIVSASNDTTLKVWDIEHGKVLATLRGHTAAVNSITVLSCGRWIVSASDDETLRVWDVELGKVITILKGHTASVKSVVGMGDDRHIVSVSTDKTFKVWDIKQGIELASFIGHQRGATVLAVVERSWQVISTSRDTLKVWDVKRGMTFSSLSSHIDWVNALAVFEHGSRLVSVSDDQTLKIWDTLNGRELETHKEHSTEVIGVAVFSQSQMIISITEYELFFWDSNRGVQLSRARDLLYEVRDVGILKNEQQLVLASKDKTLKVWDIDGGSGFTLTGHTGEVTTVAVLNDGQRIVSGSTDKTIAVWDLKKKIELTTCIGHRKTITSLVIFEQRQMIISASYDQTIRMWDLETGKELATLTEHTKAVKAVAVHPDGRRLVSASEDETLKVWDVETQQVLLTYLGDAPFLTCAVAPDGKTIFAGDKLGRVHFLKLEEH